MTQGEILAEQLAETRRWGLMLLVDFQGSDWYFQPAPGLAHALWLCGHLAISQDTLIHQRCLGHGILEDSFRRHFLPGSPVKSGGEHDWPDPELVLATMARVHERTLVAVRDTTDDLLAEPAYGPGGSTHPHYRSKLGAISHAVRHEAFHLGQIATIRRLLGRNFLR